MSAQTQHAAPTDVPDPPVVRRRRRRRVLLALLLVVLVLVVLAGWLALRAVEAARALADATDELGSARVALDARDVDALVAGLPRAQEAMDRARSASSDPVWKLAEHIPWMGAQLRAVSTVSASLDDVVRGIAPAADEARLLLDGDTVRRPDGSFDVEAISAAAPKLTAAAEVTTRAHQDVAAIPTGNLVGRLAGPVQEATEGLGTVSTVLTSLGHAATLLPPMLGADGQRTYLMLALNTAELRSAGGIVGSVLEVSADDGHMKLVRHVTTADLGGLESSVLPLTDSESDLYGSALGRWIQNAPSTPDFPRTAQLVAARWERDIGGDVDGVIATDPVAVRDVLGALGLVKAPDGTVLDPSTFVQVLLSDTYRTTPTGTAADAVFSAVAATVFGALADGSGSTQDLIKAVVNVGDERRLRVWSAHDDEQAVLAASELGGAFLTGDHPDAVGVFLNDATQGKLDYYLDARVSVQDMICTGPDPTATVRIDLTYTPPTPVTSLPDSVLGNRQSVFAPGDLATEVLVFAPVDAPLDSLTQGDALVAGASSVQDGRHVVSATSVLSPGQATSYLATVPVRHGAVEVWTTPTLTGGGYTRVPCAG